MKVMIMQPPYPQKGEALKVLEWQKEQLDKLTPGEADLVIFPENANCTGYGDMAELVSLIKGPGMTFIEKIRETVKRVNCTVMSGLLNYGTDGVLRNQLTVFPPDGEPFSPYTKVHLVEPELAKGIEPGTAPVSFEYKGVRYGASICFDHYFPELFVQYAKQRVDVLIVRNVIAAVVHRGTVDGGEPDDAHAKLFEIVQLGSNAFEVARAVAVCVAERTGIDLIGDAVFPPAFVDRVAHGACLLKKGVVCRIQYSTKMQKMQWFLCAKYAFFCAVCY